MKRFFYFYTLENACENAIQLFSLQHLLWMIVTVSGFGCLYRYLKELPPEQINRAEKILISTLVIGDWIYYVWVIFTTPYSPLNDILPLHLCSFGVYMTAFAFFLNNEKLRRMVAVTNTFGALIALLYPATVTAMFPPVSYRVVYFFYEHGLIAFLGIWQIKRFEGLRYRDIKFNMIPLSILAAVAFSVNMLIHTDYLFIGTPPTIGLIKVIYETVGIYLFLPVAILGLLAINLLVTSVAKAAVYLSKRASIEYAGL